MWLYYLPSWKLFFLLYVCFKIVLWKSVWPPINWNIEKTLLWILMVWKEGIKETIWASHRLPLYLAFSTGIYLCKINIKGRKALCKVCQKLARKANVRNYVFTNMLILYYFDFCPLFEFIISITILCNFYHYTYVSTLISYISTLIPLIFHIVTQILYLPTLIPCIGILVPFLAFPPLLSAFPSVHFPILHFDFYR